MNSRTSTQTTQTLTGSAVHHQKYLKDIKPPRGTKHKVFHSLQRRGAINISQPQPGPGSLADCVLIEKERGTLIVRGHSFEVGLLHFKCLSSACLSPSGSKVHAASQQEQKTLSKMRSETEFHSGLFSIKMATKEIIHAFYCWSMLSIGIDWGNDESSVGDWDFQRGGGCSSWPTGEAIKQLWAKLTELGLVHRIK